MDRHRAVELEWLRSFIEHNCILRLPADKPLLTNYDKGLGSYQYFAQVATLDQEFMARASALFWRDYLEQFRARPFQLCGCETGGVQIVCALQAKAYQMGFNVNVFGVKKARKTYGLKNWFEGIILEDMPILLVDDVIGGLITMRAKAQLMIELQLPLAGAFAIAACKPNRSPALEIDGQRLFDVHTFFRPEDFTPKHVNYIARYGKHPKFIGSMV
jgi:orotate phosphoribosyltransferase